MTIGQARARAPRWRRCPDVLTEEDVANLAAHYARQRARAVVYVTLPSK